MAQLESKEPQFSVRRSEYKNLGRVIQLSLSFLLLFSAFNTCQNLTSTVLADDNLGSFGYYTLATLYLSLSVSAFLSSALLKKMGMYTCFFVGSLGHSSFVIASILPAYRYDFPGRNNFLQATPTIIATLLIAATFNGFGAGILWCALGNYISECATPSTKGLYFGLFWFFYMMSMTLGSLMGAAMLGSGMNETYFYIILSAIALVANGSFLLIRKPLPKEVTAEMYESVLTNTAEVNEGESNPNGLENSGSGPQI